MKILAGIAVAGFLVAGQASASSFYVSGVCGIVEAVGSGTFACPTYAALGGILPVAGEFLIEDSNYALGVGGAGSLVTDFAYSGGPAEFLTDAITSTGAAGLGGTPVSEFLGALNPPNATTGALAGFYDDVTSPFGTVTINYTATANAAAQGISAYVQVVYAYNTVSAVPEPTSLLLCVTGLLAVALLARRRLAGR